MSSLILCGGTGAHLGMTLLRLHTLGEALGFFGRTPEFPVPAIFLVDQDSGDGEQGRTTAWQMVRNLVDLHPARLRWTRPDLQQISPLPIGLQQNWSQIYSTLGTRFESSRFLEILASERQRAIDYSKGMMGSPSTGALLFKLKEFDARERLNHDKAFGELFNHRGRIVVAGSGVGGTGAAVGPTLARILAEDRSRKVMAVMVLNWFRFEENEGDQELRSKAQLRNRLLRENANSALQFYGRRLADTVAAVPVGVPESAMVRRVYTGDTAQPVQESFIHGVAALCAARHFLHENNGYEAGLYAMGAADPGKLAGGTAIPGGTLQDLANQAATVAYALRVWKRVLEVAHTERLQPRLFEVVHQLGADPQATAGHLEQEIAHYEEQIEWMRTHLEIAPQPAGGFFREADVRERLHQFPLTLGPLKPEPEPVTTVLFQWTAQWVRDEARPENGLRNPVATVGGKHWPDRVTEAVDIAPKAPGELTQIQQHNIDAVLSGFINPTHITCNGWPHPVAALDYFRFAVERQDRAALRQLELMLVGLVAKTLELRPVAAPRQEEPDVSLESLISVYSRGDYPDFGTAVLVQKTQNGERIVGFNSPYTLFCPVPFMDDDVGNRLWNGLWWSLSGTEDGTPWNDFRRGSRAWGENERIVQLIRSWLRQERRQRKGSAPAWTRVFSDRPGPDPVVLFGLGARLRVFWGADSESQRPPVAIQLPTPEEDGAELPEDLPILEEADLLAAVPELVDLRGTGGEVLFQAVEFEAPGVEGMLRGFWDDHLARLQELGRIQFRKADREGRVVIGTLVDDEPHVTTLTRSRLLRVDLIAVRRWQPLTQRPLRTPPGIGEKIKLPDLPLRGDYLDLVQVGEGSLLAALKEKRYETIPAWPAIEGERNMRSWRLPMKGRRDSLLIQVEAEEEPAEAHWMVWPRVRAREDLEWRAYYVFEHCTNRHLHLDTLWLDGEGRVRRRPAGGQLAMAGEEVERRAYPVHYEADRGRHGGGPPLALSLRNLQTGAELGIYLVRLELLRNVPSSLALAIDFGTSHTVAAARIEGKEESTVVELQPELSTEAGTEGLSLHISERAPFVVTVEDGLLATGGWMPTYVARGKNFLPSELLLLQRAGARQATNTRRWVPGQDFLIPPLEFGRDRLADFLLSDFKWNASSQEFEGHEGELRTHFLSHFLELALADVIAYQLKGFPRKPIDLTFTYPLRSSESEIRKFQESLDEVLERAGAATGLTLQLKDGSGIYDESRAARVSRQQFGQVSIVGDLGGGNLDLLISTYSNAEEEAKRFPDLADSARLGGNLLLGRLAGSPERFLPKGGGWKRNGDTTRDIEAKLRAWMRSEGAPHLFGTTATRSEFAKMRLRGFERESEGNAARKLIERYFRLIIEYMARNLVAYLHNTWYPRVEKRDYGRLKILVQLRGNGWRLRYQGEDPAAATTAIREQIQARVEELWRLLPNERFPVPPAGCWLPAEDYEPEELKLAPVRRVAGKAQDDKDVWQKWYTHTLVDLEVLLDQGPLAVPWHSKVPFASAGSRRVEIGTLSPPIPLSNPQDERPFVISSLENVGEINEGLRERSAIDPGKLEYQAPVAPLVWEAVFKSKEFLG